MNSMMCLVAVSLTAAPACSAYTADRFDVSQYLAQWQAPLASDPPPRLPTGPAPAPTGASGPLDLEQAVSVALVTNPGLRVLRLRAGSAKAGAEVAGDWANPVLSAELRRAVDGGPSPWFVAASLDFTVPLSARHGDRRDLALAAANVERLAVVAQERALATNVRLAWIDWSLQVHHVELLQAYLASVSAIDTIASRLSAAGELPLEERRVLPIEEARTRIEVDVARGKARQLRDTLTALLGLHPQAPVHFAASLEPSGLASTPKAQWQRSHVRVLLAQAGIDVAGRRTRLERARRSPDLTFGPTVEYDGDRTSVGIGISLPIPSLDLNRRGIAQARGGASVARARAELEAQSLVWERRTQLAKLERATKRLATLQSLQTLVAAQLKQVQDLARKGELNTLLLRHAMRESLSTRLSSAMARRDIAAARTQLMDLGGAP